MHSYFHLPLRGYLTASWISYRSRHRIAALGSGFPGRCVSRVRRYGSSFSQPSVRFPSTPIVLPADWRILANGAEVRQIAPGVVNSGEPKTALHLPIVEAGLGYG